MSLEYRDIQHCSMPSTDGNGVCGQRMTSSRVAPIAPGAVAVLTSKCPVCDVRRCKCKWLVQDGTARHCPKCGVDLRVVA